jgi:hypothetical protein
MIRQDKRSMMLSMVAQWQQSGMSQSEFARVQNLTLVKFRYWIQQHRKQESSGSGFIQLENFSQQDISIRYPNGVELSLPMQAPVGLIKSLLNL